MFKDQILEFLNNYGVPNGFSNLLASGLIFISIVLIVLIINFIGRIIILSFFRRIAKSTANAFDDLLIKNKVPRLLSFVPSLFFLFCEGGYISLNFTSSSLDTLLNLIG